ncbi:MAG: glycosyltransferase family 9 protein [Acidimicrobiia bacterium]
MARSAQLQSDRGNPRLKFLDRYVGIPVIVVLGLLRRLRGSRPVPADWKSIGLLLTAGIGDTVVATGVLRDLRETFPRARIVLFVTANNASFARMVATPDAVVELPVRQVWRAVSAVRTEAVDVLVDLSAWRRFDAVLAALSGARVAIGLRTPGQHRHFAYDVVVDHGRDHEIENDRRLVRALGLRSECEPEIPLPDGAQAPLDRPYVVFHLWPGGANFEERSWPIDSWRQLATHVCGRGYDIVLTGGPGDVPVADGLVRTWGEAGVRVHNAAGGSWPDSLRWLGFAAGVISVNTGVMHVGAALGTPTIALNGPTSGRRWGPRGLFTRSVASPMVPDGYLNLGFEQDDRYRECMSAITVEMVLEAWDALMCEVAAAHS